MDVNRYTHSSVTTFIGLPWTSESLATQARPFTSIGALDIIKMPEFPYRQGIHIRIQ